MAHKLHNSSRNLSLLQLAMYDDSTKIPFTREYIKSPSHKLNSHTSSEVELVDKGEIEDNMLKLASCIVVGFLLASAYSHGEKTPLEKYVIMKLTESCFGKAAVAEVWGKMLSASVKCQLAEPVLPEVTEVDSRIYDLPLSLGKIGQIGERARAKTGNVTCVLRELEMLTESYELNVDAMKNKIQALEVSDNLKKDLLAGMDSCLEFSSCAPTAKVKVPLIKHLMKPMGFFRCFNTKKIMACAKNDLNERIAAGAPRDAFDNFDSEDPDQPFGIQLFSVIYGLDVEAADKMFAVL